MTSRLRAYALLAAASLAVSSAKAQDLVPSTTAYEFAGRDSTTTVTMRLEPFVLPDESPLFNLPTRVFVDGAGRSYWVDVVDRDVKVFGDDMDYLRTLGREGQGPGEFAFPWVVDFAPDGTAYIYDNEANRLSLFSPDGQFLESAAIPVSPSTYSNTCGIRLLEDGTFLLVAPTRQGVGAGLTVHRFNMSRNDGVLALTHAKSVYSAPRFEPAIDPAVLGCNMSATTDGGFVLSFWTPYRVSKWNSAGYMEWEHVEADLLPNATDFFGLTAEGRVEIRDFPQSSLLVQVAEGTYLHMMMWPAEEGARTLEEGGTYVFRRRLELLVAEDSGVESFCCVEQEEEFQFHAVDKQGRIYGFWNDAQMVPVRWEVHVQRENR